ncbi:hypothetical protein ACFSR7_36130 [Cohnella sp. GCM10020058]|uniref:hypothetical protein n=1 Tax=Cohnella sp. GCM10020058 TaxID=3317330 RepID=UPI00362AB2C9
MALAKRSLAALMAVLILVTLIIPPQKKAGAVLPALAVGAEAGIGAYVLAAFAVSAGAELLGYTEYGADVNERARRTWINANQAIKDSIVASYNAAANAGDNMMHLGADVIAYLRSEMKGSVIASSIVSYPQTDWMTKAGLSGVSTGNAWYYTAGKDSNGNLLRFWYGNINAGYFYVYDNPSYQFRIDLNLCSDPNGQCTILSLPGANFYNSKATAGLDFESIFKFYMSLAGVVVRPLSLDTSLTQAKLNDYVSDAIPLPLPGDVVPYPKTSTGTLDKDAAPLVWDPALQKYKTQSGSKVYNPGDVAWKFPEAVVQPKAKPTDVPVVTVPIGGVQTNVKTGEKVGTDTGTGTGSLDWSIPTSAGLDFTPLLVAGDLTKKFPFSIPWDVWGQLKVFDVPPQAPHIHIEQPVDISGMHFPIMIDMDMSQFDPFAQIARWFLIICFDLGIILGLRRLMPE